MYWFGTGETAARVMDEPTTTRVTAAAATVDSLRNDGPMQTPWQQGAKRLWSGDTVDLSDLGVQGSI
jgi:hypothetical protein